MNCKQYNEKYETPDKEQDFWKAIKTWLQDNPDHYIIFRTYIPQWNDGEDCLPQILLLGKAPGFVDDYYVDSTGKIHTGYDLHACESERLSLPKKDQNFLETVPGWYEDCEVRRAHRDWELGAVLHDGFEAFIQEWNVTGTIKLVNDRRRKNHGEPTVDTVYYDGNR